MKKKHNALRLIIFLVFLYALFGTLAYSFDNKLMFPAPKRSYDKELPGLVKLSDEENPIYAVWMKNPNATQTILYCHGNGEDIGDVYPVLVSFRNAGFSVLCPDYEGYGLSNGRRSEKGCYRAVSDAYHFLRDNEKISSDKIIVFGFSIGSGSAVELSTHEPIGGLILQSPFLSAYRVITKIKIFPFDVFDNLSKIKALQCPILVIHGTEDQVIPFWHGKQLFEQANVFPQNKFVPVQGANHNNLVSLMGEDYLKTIQSFIQSIAPLQFTAGMSDETILKMLGLDVKTLETETIQGKDGTQTTYKSKDTAAMEVNIVRSMVTGLKVTCIKDGKTKFYSARN